MDARDLTVVIPVLNENTSTMIHTLRDIYTWLNDVNVIFVDDHSDNVNTLEGFNILKKEFNVKVIKNIGYGQEMALYTGIKCSNTTYIACVDCDGQEPISVLSVMYEQIKGTDVLAAAGVREMRDDSVFRIICANIYHFLFQKILRKKIPAISNFFIIHRDLKNKLNPEYIRGIVYLVPDACYVPYKRRARLSGKSRFTFLKLFKVACAGFKFAKVGKNR